MLKLKNKPFRLEGSKMFGKKKTKHPKNNSPFGFMVNSNPLTSLGSAGATFIGHNNTRNVDKYKSTHGTGLAEVKPTGTEPSETGIPLEVKTPEQRLNETVEKLENEILRLTIRLEELQERMDIAAFQRATGELRVAYDVLSLLKGTNPVEEIEYQNNKNKTRKHQVQPYTTFLTNGTPIWPVENT